MNPFPHVTGESPRLGGIGPRMWAGVGFKPQHFDALMTDDAPPGFIEIHAENYMGQGGVPHAQLTRLRECMPVFLHGVGLSIGAEHAPDPKHLDRLAVLIDRYQPQVFSEHLAWSTHDGCFYNDLLPLCYDAPTLQRVCDHIDQVQARLGVRMLLENPSTYFEFEGSTLGEAEFIAAVVERTGCGLLLDVNNIHVSCHNNGHDPQAYLDALPLSEVAEIHLAGFAVDGDGRGLQLLIDNHGGEVADPVWALYRQVIRTLGPLPSLIEWDTDVPDYRHMCDQARRADTESAACRVLTAPVEVAA